MATMLFLAKGVEGTLSHIDGQCILDNLPFDTVVYVNKNNVQYFKNVPENVTVELVSWGFVDQLREKIRQDHAKYNFFAICAVQELMIEFAAEMRVELNIAGHRPADVSRFRNKVEMKQLLDGSGVRVPQFTICDHRDEVNRLQEKCGKIVIKPKTGLSSIGVSFIDSAEQLQNWYDKHDSPDEYEAEEFIDGTLYHVDAVVRNGEVIVNAPAQYLPGMANIDYPKGAPFATVMQDDGDLYRRLQDVSLRVMNALALRNGVTHLECFVTADNDIVFCEIGSRPAGGGIVWMLELQYGVQFSRAQLLLDAGRGDLIEVKPRHDAAGLIGFRGGNAMGIVAEAPSAEKFQDDWIHLVRIYVEKGGLVVPTAHCTDYLGAMVISAENQEAFQDKLENLQQRFYGDLAIEPM